MFGGLLSRIFLKDRARQKPTDAEKRVRLINRGRRGREISISPQVSQLPTRASGQFRGFERPTVLVLQLAHIGDFILSLRALKKLRDGFPDSDITLVSAPWNADWAKKTGMFTRVTPFDFFPRLNQDWHGVKPELFDRFEALGLGSFDIAIDLRHDEDTRPCLFRVDAKVRAGYQAPVEIGRPHLDLMLPNIEKLPLTDGTEYSLHAELRFELMADAVLSAYGRRSEPHPASSLADPALAPKIDRPFIVLALSAGDPIRRWPTARFAEVAEKIVAGSAYSVVLVGGTPEKDAIDAVMSKLPPDRITCAIEMALVDLAALVSRSSLVIGLGTGVTHLSATLGVPTVAILSGVSPLSVWRPVGPRVIGLTGLTPCSPCGFRTEGQCPFDVACLRSVTVAHVTAAMRQLMDDRPGFVNPQMPQATYRSTSNWPDPV